MHLTSGERKIYPLAVIEHKTFCNVCVSAYVQANAILDFRISKIFDTIPYEEILIAIKISKFLGRLSVVFSIR